MGMKCLFCAIKLGTVFKYPIAAMVYFAFGRRLVPLTGRNFDVVQTSPGAFSDATKFEMHLLFVKVVY